MMFEGSSKFELSYLRNVLEHILTLKKRENEKIPSYNNFHQFDFPCVL